MQEHEEQKTTEVSAAYVRVTAEEFARAVARYQTRREEAAQHLEGTVTLGEAVQELGLDATPEELWQEVQAARVQQDLPAKSRYFPQIAWISAGLLIGVILCLWLWALSLRQPLTPSTATTPPPIAIERTKTGTKIMALGDTQVLNGQMLDTLANVKDDHSVLCALSAASDSISFTNYSSSDTSWTLIKHDGNIYIRGWIAAMTSAALKTSTVTIYNSKAGVSTGVAPQQITLCLDNFQAVPSLSSDEMINAWHIQPDSHFRESWNWKR